MAYWLARQRDGQETGFIQRFDPRFWTVNFPRPMMAALTNPAPDAIRVDAVFHRRNDLAGLIWESADQWDHPLLAYVTDENYQRTELSFRWRSAGVLPLDAVNGPTLTIEGRDAAGEPRAWYVRLWNYATGTPEDAVVRLRFSQLAGGFLHPAEADPVHAAAIERMFISLVPPGYNAAGGDLTAAAAAWVELTDIRCDGERAMLEIGDAWVPTQGLNLATAYDDGFNQAPMRLLRNLRQLGYGTTINHYLGMSHFFPLTADGAGGFVVDPALPALNVPARAWHAAFFAEAQTMGMSVIASLSYELLAMHCPEAWQQRTAAGEPSRTGWDPPSALLSPGNGAAMAWLRKVATALVGLQQEAGLPVRFQIGEPWWWVMPGGQICLYDDAAKAALGGNPVVITDLRAPLSASETALLDQAGALLAQSTAALAQAVRDAAGAGGAEVLLLAFLPTVLDPAMPEVVRANLPVGWASPAFDTLQLEDYDWLTSGQGARRAQARVLAEARLHYPRERQHYLAGFVLNPGDSDQWREIDRAAGEAMAIGVAKTFIWALPQVCRDGYLRLPDFEETETMQAFDDVLYPIALGREAAVLPEFSTAVTVTASGHEQRNSLWSDARLRFDVGPGIRSDHELGILIAFFRARRGMARGFRLRDPSDFSSAGMTDAPGPGDQLLGTGDGARDRYPLIKRYGDGEEPQVRFITRPQATSVRISVAGIEQTSGWTLEPMGVVRFAEPPPSGAEVRGGFYFEVPVRFAEDQLEIAGSFATAGDAPSVPLVEIREAP